MKQFNKVQGKIGEEMAAKYLIEKGFQMIEANYSTKFGEIDLIAVKNDILHFVEVKLKTGDLFGTPEEMIGLNKIGRVRRMAEFYLLENPDMAKVYQTYSIDAVCIVVNENGLVERLNYYENVSF